MDTAAFFQSLYKQTGNNAGQVDNFKNVRKQSFDVSSRSRHQHFIDSRRKVSDMVITPVPSTSRENKHVDAERTRGEDRRSKLEKWKQQKLAKKAIESKSKKPVFKVGCFARIPSLRSMYRNERKEITTKKVEPNSDFKVPGSHTFNFKLPKEMNLKLPKNKVVVNASPRVTISNTLGSQLPERKHKLLIEVEFENKSNKGYTRTVRFAAAKRELAAVPLSNSEEKENLKLDSSDVDENDLAAGATPRIRRKVLSSCFVESPTNAIETPSKTPKVGLKPSSKKEKHILKRSAAVSSESDDLEIASKNTKVLVDIQQIRVTDAEFTPRTRKSTRLLEKIVAVTPNESGTSKKSLKITPVAATAEGSLKSAEKQEASSSTVRSSSKRGRKLRKSSIVSTKLSNVEHATRDEASNSEGAIDLCTPDKSIVNLNY